MGPSDTQLLYAAVGSDNSLKLSGMASAPPVWQLLGGSVVYFCGSRSWGFLVRHIIAQMGSGVCIKIFSIETLEKK